MRTKRKVATHIHGLDLFGVDLKKAAKLFAGKFATGSSLSKNPQGEDEIVVQGDVGDEIVSLERAARLEREDGARENGWSGHAGVTASWQRH